ncbi:MAG TPA: carbon storage regulator [Pirellulales bacterium]|jgi:carbon storage regulator|nr:carbon storage regulator [Pirellulales bacterium]
MLVLTRRPEETIVIDGRITIAVVQIQGGAVRLGIEAPRAVRVNRGEIEARIGQCPKNGTGTRKACCS